MPYEIPQCNLPSDRGKISVLECCNVCKFYDTLTDAELQMLVAGNWHKQCTITCGTRKDEISQFPSVL